MARPTLTLFQHIPKTAGTSLRTILEAAYGDRLRLAYGGELRLGSPSPDFLDDVAQSNCEAICGHFAFGAHAFFADHDVRYVTFLRNPEERCISHFRHVAREPRSRHFQAISEGMTLKHLIEAHRAPEQNNHFMRLLSGSTFKVDLWPPNPLDQFGQIDQIFERQHLVSAQENIKRHYLFVGLTERFETDVASALNAAGIRYGGSLEARMNVADNSAPLIDDDTRATIAKYNALDIELYDGVLSRP